MTKVINVGCPYPAEGKEDVVIPGEWLTNNPTMLSSVRIELVQPDDPLFDESEDFFKMTVMIEAGETKTEDLFFLRDLLNGAMREWHRLMYA